MIRSPSRRTRLLATALALLVAAPGVQAATKARKKRPPPAPKHLVLDPLTPTPPPPPLPITEGDWRTPDPDDLLIVDTNKGRIIAELTPLAAPETVARIKTLARQHFYDGRSFFRVIDGVQVAEPSGAAEGLLGVLPVDSQPDAIMALTNDGKATAWPFFCPGVLGFARNASPDSGNSQFFFMRAAYPALEKRYTAFGRVISGQDVVNAIKTGEPVAKPQDIMTRVRLGDDLPPSEQLHVRVLDPSKDAFKVLVARSRDEKGADFSVCDLTLPAEVK